MEEATRTDWTGQPLYSGPIFDEFGNEVVGITEQMTLIVKARPIPIDLDRYYRPVSPPRLALFQAKPSLDCSTLALLSSWLGTEWFPAALSPPLLAAWRPCGWCGACGLTPSSMIPARPPA